jgi:membrane protein YdbS with pleckstrin-like domain
MQKYKPSKQFLRKLILAYSLIALVVLMGISIFSGLISLDDRQAALNVFIFLTIPDLIFWIVAMILLRPYYRSLSYEILEDEVIVHVGIFTHSVKHVPYRTVTNLSIKRDIFDRWFYKLGSLNIQTAGMSGQQGAEEQLLGLENVDEVYQLVAKEIRRFKGAMSPTQTDTELEPNEINIKILDELVKIRSILEK